MAREHTLKTWPSFFQAIRDGAKTFEVRRNDRDFEVGDTLNLVEWDPTPTCGSWPAGHATGRHEFVRVTYVLQGGQWGVEKGFVVMGIEAERAKGEKP
jgi:hypothetical protein